MNTDELNRNVSDFEALHDVNLDGADALVAALQESAAHIRDLRERIATLEECQLARRIDALESDVSVLRDAQSDSNNFVQIANRDYTDALRWLGIAASEGLDHSTRISFIEDAVGALHKCSKDEGEL